MIKEHSKEIFGEDSLYFDVKHKLKSKSGIGSIPDAYVIKFGEPHEWYVVENELSSHPIFDHIVKQLTKRAPLEVIKCMKCGKIIAEPKNIRFWNSVHNE